MTPTLDYAVNSAVWTVFGLVVGFAVGRVTKDVRRIADAVTDDEGGTVIEPVKRRRRLTGQQLLGVVVVLLGLLTAAQGLYQDSQTRRVAVCTQAYADGFADALEARAKASAEAQNALDDLWSTVGQLTTQAGSPDARAKFNQALSDYLGKRAEAKKQQAENPFPAPPRDLCK